MPLFISEQTASISKAMTAVSEKKLFKAPTVETMLDIGPQLVTAFARNETILSNNLKDLTPKEFGVIGHLDPTRSMLVDAIRGIKSLREDFVGEDSISVRALELAGEDHFKNYSGISGAPTFANFSLPLATIIYQEKSTADPTKMVDATVTINSIDELPKVDSKANPSSLYSAGLFSAGTTIRNDIIKVDNFHNVFMSLQADLSRTLSHKKNELAKLDAEIPVVQRSLANLNQERLKTLGDYQVVRALVEENWAEVEKKYRKREKILTNHRGIYYARVREAPYSVAPLTDSPLRFGQLEDLVPSLALQHDELPDDIEPFVDAVIEIPIANWKAFNAYWDLLPNRDTLQKLMGQRKSRLDYSNQQNNRMASNKFSKMQQSHQSIMQDHARFSFFYEPSLQAFNRQAVKIISLEDLLKGSPHQLRSKAQEFRNRVDQATHSLLSQLHNIKPSIRLDWAKAAELDQLDLRNPQAWPGLDAAKLQDLTGIRTFMELVNWWWRQLNDDATGACVTAIRNLLRAALMVAAGDDPDEMLHGQLQFIPNGFRLGEVLRVNLNRSAPIGTVLQLMNDKDQLIGQLRVEDADEKGSVVSITQVYSSANSHTASSQYSVLGKKKTVGRS